MNPGRVLACVNREYAPHPCPRLTQSGDGHLRRYGHGAQDSFGDLEVVVCMVPHAVPISVLSPTSRRVHATTEYGRDAVPIQWAMRTVFGAYDNLSLAPVKLVPFKY